MAVLQGSKLINSYAVMKKLQDFGKWGMSSFFMWLININSHVEADKEFLD